jgi:hypothetical protein
MLVAVGAVVGLAGPGRSERGSTAVVGSKGASTATDRAVGAPDGSSGAAGGRARSATPSAGVVDGTNAPAPAVPAPGGAPVPGIQPRIARRAQLSLRVGRSALGSKLQDAENVASDLGGYVVRSERARAGASVTMRVPADKYDAALKQLGDLGRVTASSQSGDDRTAEFVDREARLRNLRAQEATLQDIMRQARTIPDTIAVQQQLSAVQDQIEQLTGQQNLLDGETSFASIEIGFSPTGAPPVRGGDPGPSLAGAGGDALDVMVSVIGGMIVVLGAVVPFAVLGALGYLVWGASRRRRPRLGGAEA